MSQALRTWIEIDLDALIANYRTACGLTKATVTCVLKSNAYGHGAVQVGKALEAAGCRSFAVSCSREALELRGAGVNGEILNMGLTEPDAMEELLAAGNMLLTAASVDDLQAIDRAAEKAGVTARVHLKLDTGFHRLGFDCTESAAREAAEAIRALRHTRVEELYSHLGLVTRERDELQHARLMRFRDWLAEAGVTLDKWHLCDSIGLVRYPQWHGSRCRVGALLYGMRPFHTEDMPFSLAQTLVFKSRIAQIHTVEPGEVVGYDEAIVRERPMRVATVCAGYGDGYPRRLSNGAGKVAVRGKRAPVVGLVCMDQLMADVTDIPDCRAGDEVTLLGGDIPVAEAADWAHTNRNECLTILSRRPVRVYRQGGRVIETRDDLLD